MGKRAFLIAQETLAILFENRGPTWASVVRMGGPHLPADAGIRGLLFVPPRQAFALIYESAEWSDVAVAGQRTSNINGIQIVEGAQICWLMLAPNGNQIPGCQVAEIDVAGTAPPPLTESQQPCPTTTADG